MKTDNEVANEVRDLIITINKSRVRLLKLKQANPSLRVGYRICAGGILNAYREGDLNFMEAVTEIENLKPRPLGIAESIRELLLSEEFLKAFAVAFATTPLPSDVMDLSFGVDDYSWWNTVDTSAIPDGMSQSIAAQIEGGGEPRTD